MLNSRKKYTKEKFVKRFLETLIPGLIKRKEFIDWNRIFNANESCKNFIKDLEQCKNYHLKRKI